MQPPSAQAGRDERLRMSSPGPAQQIAMLLSGRWQIPIALAAALVGGVMLYRLMPGRATIDFGGLLADVTALEQAGATGDAADALANLLDMEPPLPPSQRAELHDRLAELIYGQELGRHTPNPANVRVLLEHHQAAAQLGCPQDAGRLLRFARVVDWLGDEAQATAAYRTVLKHDPLPEQRRLALQGLVRRLEAGPDAGVIWKHCCQTRAYPPATCGGGCGSPSRRRSTRTIRFVPD